jgi:hypothetical protein
MNYTKALPLLVGFLALNTMMIQVFALPAEASTTKRLTRSERRIVQSLKTACKALLLQSNDPKAIAEKFGTVTEITVNNDQIVQPFNTDIYSIEVSTDSFRPLPYPAKYVDFNLKPTPSILSISSLRQEFGKYYNGRLRLGRYPITFLYNVIGDKPNTCYFQLYTVHVYNGTQEVPIRSISVGVRGKA